MAERYDAIIMGGGHNGRTEIKAVPAYYCGIGTFVGPKSPGSAYVVLHHLMGEHAGAGGWGFVRGGIGSITQAIARSGQEKGLVVKTECERLDRDGERTRDRRHARGRNAL
jgi:phytoene dehydrogenase-like protein